jgi:hypothetical protein
MTVLRPSDRSDQIVLELTEFCNFGSFGIPKINAMAKTYS